MTKPWGAPPKIVWCLWEPVGTLPGYLRACLRTIGRNSGAEVQLLGATDVKDLAPELDERLAARIPRIGQRSDYFRSHLLYAQGGMWIDIDSIVMHSVVPLIDMAAEHDLVARRSISGHVSTTPIACRPRSPILASWIELQERVLGSMRDGDELPWTALGGRTLNKAADEGRVHLLDSELVAPVPWTEAKRFLSRFESPNVALDAAPIVVALYNAAFPERLRATSESDVLRSRMMMARLLRIALGESTVEDECFVLDRLGAPLARTGRRLGLLGKAARFRLRGRRSTT